MKLLKRISALILTMVLVCSFACVNASAQKNIADESRDSVVFITTDIYAFDQNGREFVFYEEAFSGTGFAIGKKGKPVEYIVTNAHVTEKSYYFTDGIVGSGEYATGIKVYFNQKANDFMIPRVVYFDRDKDICILQLPEVTTKREALPFADADKVTPGENVYVLGYPDYGGVNQDEAIKHDQSDVMVAKGVISKRTSLDWYGRGKLVDVFMGDASSSNGNSGGPYINDKGEVVGIYSGALLGGTDYNTTSSAVAISSAEVIRALKTIDVSDYTVGRSGGIGIVVIIILVVAAAAGAVAFVLFSKKGNKKTASPAAANNAQPSASTGRNVAIIGVSGNFKDSTFVLKDKLVIGRNPASCTICYPVDTKGVSGVHCEIRKKGSAFEIVDCGSSNGTFLGSGQRLQPNVPVAIDNGTYFYLGSSAQMFQIKEV